MDALRERACDRLDAETWAYLEAGADDGLTAASAAEAWQRILLRPRVLRGVGQIDTATTILGRAVPLPIMAAPTGRATRYHPDGELALLEGAAGAIVVLPSSIAASVDALLARQPGAIAWQQLYIATERAFMRDQLSRIGESGCAVVVVTADLLPGDRPSPAAPPPAAWENPQPPRAPGAFAAASLDDLAWLCGEAGLPVVVKGVLRGDDAEACLAAGARGIIVSNHGGNQLDTAISSARALEEVVGACGDRGEVYIDGGIRRGTSVLKALALGARAVLVGRPASYGLAAGGADGVAEMFGLLKSELIRAMALCGVADLGDIDRSLIANDRVGTAP